MSEAPQSWKEHLAMEEILLINVVLDSVIIDTEGEESDCCLCTASNCGPAVLFISVGLVPTFLEDFALACL